MKVRVATFIANYLVKKGVKEIFTVTGGGAMYLNDAFGHHGELHCTYNHHEQASAMAAEAYARMTNTPALVCVTTGPGATNAITGVVGAWMGSIPMLVISGQARYETTVYKSKLNLRTRGVQEFDIIDSVRNMTKYCTLVKEPETIKYHLDRAIYLATSGRPGPCWLDIPLDVQGAIIETEELKEYTIEAPKFTLSSCLIFDIVTRIYNSKRPLILIGNGVRLSGSHDRMLSLIDKLNIPVVTTFGSVDAIASDHPLYIGRTGTTGDRAANFAVQNADLLLSFGSRLSFNVTGFNYKEWARKAYKIVNDIDENEIEKDSINADIKVNVDVSLYIDWLLKEFEFALEKKLSWINRCLTWKRKYPVVLERHYQDEKPNIYVFFKEMTSRLQPDDALVVSVGTSRVVGSQASIIKEGMRFITNPVTAAMGFDLPAAIGVARARKGKRTVLVTGEGSIQMNLQELETIIFNKMPVVIFLMNNEGYHSIRMTQNSYFGKPLVGVGPESGDLAFPDFSKIAYAYGIDYKACKRSQDLDACIDWALENKNICVCELFLSKEQVTEPKVASRKLADGKMISATLENMAPFLSEEEIKANMVD